MFIKCIIRVALWNCTVAWKSIVAFQPQDNMYVGWASYLQSAFFKTTFFYNLLEKIWSYGQKKNKRRLYPLFMYSFCETPISLISFLLFESRIDLPIHSITTELKHYNNVYCEVLTLWYFASYDILPFLL